MLKARGIAYQEINISLDSEADARMVELSGRTSVPQIFVGTHHVGGCDDLIAADASGELAQLVKPYEPEAYEPIACSTYDELELACVRRINISVATDDGVLTGIAHTLRTHNRAEVLVLDEGGEGMRVVRLDQIRNWQIM